MKKFSVLSAGASALLALVLVLLLSTPALAWEPLDNFQCREDNTYSVWRANTFPNTYNINDQGYSRVSMDEVRRVFRDSWAEWGRPCCSSWRSTEGPLTDRRPLTNRIQDRMMAFVERDWPSQWGNQNQTIAFVRPAFSGCSLVQAEMVFNAVGFRFTTGGGGTDLQAITTHEAGHWLGLDHSPIPQATMYFSYRGGTAARNLHSDDEEGVCALYPRDCSCSSDSDCTLSGEVCIDSVCRIPPCQSDSDCVGREVCEPVSGDCFLPPCTSDSECASDEICNDNGDCVIDTDCFICARCTSEADCGGGLCVPGQNFCTEFCDGAGDCPGDSQCFTVPTGQGNVQICLNPDAATGGLCPSNYTCRSSGSSGGSSNPCDGVFCASDMVCDSNTGSCIPDRTKTFDECDVCNACTSAGDCPGGGQCADIDGSGQGRCIYTCAQDGACPGNSACFQVPVQGGGQANVCLNDNAQGGGPCPSDYQCLEATGTVECPAGEVVDSATGECVDENGEGPDDGSNCDVCRRCNSDSDCIDGTCEVFGTSSYCIIECVEDEDCPGSAACFNAGGFDSRICLNEDAAENNACHGEYVCYDEGRDPGPDERDCDICKSCSSDDDCDTGSSCTAFGSLNICTVDCAEEGNAVCPGNTRCFPVSTLDTSLCLNEDAAVDGPCPTSFVCRESTGGGGDTGGDSDGGTADDNGDSGSGSDDGCGGCAASSGSTGWAHLLLLGLLLGGLRRRSIRLAHR